MAFTVISIDTLLDILTIYKSQISPYKIIDSENFIKVYQNPNKVARDTQGLPTVPHNDFGGLNFKGLASKYLLLMALPPADDEKMKKNRTSGTPTSEKTSDFASSSKVCSTKVKLKISETIFCKSYGPASEWRSMPDPPIFGAKPKITGPYTYMSHTEPSTPTYNLPPILGEKC